jgi:ketosteroid isomerase-like protein
MPSRGSEDGDGFDVEEWIDALGRADFRALRAAATDDMVVETVGSTSALAGSRTFEEFSENLAVVSEMTKNGLDCTITELTAEGDRIALEFVGKAELVDGTVFDEVHFMVLYLRDGKIYRLKKYAESGLVEAVFGSLVQRRP